MKLYVLNLITIQKKLDETCILNDVTKYQCFRQFVFELLNLRMGTFRQIIPRNPKLITWALMCTSPSVNLEKLKINKLFCY